MSVYTVPIIFTVVGWTEIEADSLAEAEKKANEINEGEQELAFGDINESDSSVEVIVDEIELLKE